MSDHNKFYLQNHHEAGNVNKVYVNPNFSRNQIFYQGNSMNMHVNPRFPTFIPNELPQPRKIPNANRIYVNPYFIRPGINNKPSVDTSKSKLNETKETHSGVQILIKEKVTETPKVMKSRYSLVRNNERKSAGRICQEKHTNTIKISKYKSVPINSIKNNMEVIRTKSILPNVIHKRQQKLIAKTNIAEKVVKSLLTLDKRRLSLVRKNNKTERQRLKINNIPCPLFKKFGKCLRSTKGHCEFSHNKKHVNICRRFLKGICHEDNCLLSHELTATKMPTCYFYLNGMCARQNCPYVHVKINDKTKVCPEFLKGYCEKANNCIYRHEILDLYTKKQKRSKKKYQNTLEEKLEINKEDIEYRYYKDIKYKNDNPSEEMETLKPCRCKLGVLPTFIQL